ncbi:acetamidase/formamidase family protein [Pseudonocardia sp.]|jgi:acetamidase/formamidase|uniref:acetamidase/formamidase family protein n=1 Tax=Pseudonocardia sp. TaxID=60912 RepID=UPI002D9C1882|nr:acetamidase/formamidase family protein [Pseudonocardia sp.]
MNLTLLQPGEGNIPGRHLLASTPETVSWGWLPNEKSTPCLTVGSGETVTIDTLSHEGILDDQGRDPVEFLGRYGVEAADVLHDAKAIAASTIPNEPDDGPHVVTGPIEIAGAEPGDVLKIDVLELLPRTPYGFVSSRHGYGALPGELPEGAQSVFQFCRVGVIDGRMVSWMAATDGRQACFPLDPFLGLMGVAPATSEPVHSVPPGDFGGNIDVKWAQVGTSLYLPVTVPGALFYTGDPHYAQGNGEVALTALEASLRATLRLTVLSGAEASTAMGSLRNPLLETPGYWIPTGMDEDLREAMKKCVRHALTFLIERFGFDRSTAMAYLSAAGDFEISQVVDVTKGVHCMIRKADFAQWY